MTKKLIIWTAKLVAWLAILATDFWAGDILLHHWKGVWLAYFALIGLFFTLLLIGWLGFVYLIDELASIVDN